MTIPRVIRDSYIHLALSRWDGLLQAFLSEWGSHPGTVVLESQIRRPELGRWSILAAQPSAVVNAEGGTLYVTDGGGRQPRGLFSKANLEACFSMGIEAPPGEAPHPYAEQGWLGYLGYEAGFWIAEMPSPLQAGESDLPEVWMARHRAVLVYDHQTGRLWSHGEEGAALTEGLLRGDEPKTRDSPAATAKADGTSFDFDSPPESYRAAIEQVREYILAGDIFQANITQRFSEVAIADGRDLFLATRQVNPASHAALLVLDRERAIVSSSPEIYLRMRPDGRLETRPIKGTVRCGSREQRPEALRTLLASRKDLAEHVMIVDVKRNDLGRVAAIPGGVRVERLHRPLSLPHLIHLESSIVGRPRLGLSPLDAIAALFPGGSISGAPKIRACEIIREVESTRRNVYTGCIGWIGATQMQLNIAIRTLYRTSPGRWHFHVGGGIVADSTVEGEWRECMAKAHGMRKSLELARWVSTTQGMG